MNVIKANDVPKNTPDNKPSSDNEKLNRCNIPADMQHVTIKAKIIWYDGSINRDE